MSRTTTVGSPTTVPMTRLSPAGTVAEQWTRLAGPGLPLGIADADVDVVGDADAVGLAGVGDECDPVLPPQPAMTTATRARTPLTRTR